MWPSRPRRQGSARGSASERRQASGRWIGGLEGQETAQFRGFEFPDIGLALGLPSRPGSKTGGHSLLPSGIGAAELAGRLMRA